MPSKSKAQQRLMGMAYAVKTGEMERSEASDAVLKLADSMSLKQLEDFAKTDRTNLPEEVDESALTGFLSASTFPRVVTFQQNAATAWIGMERDKQDPLIKSFMEFIEGKKKDDDAANEAIVGFAGVASPQGTPGMGNVAPPSAGNVGSGDRFDNGSAEDDEEEDGLKKNVGSLSYEDYKKFIKKWQKQQKDQA
jgi:hypothetical protein